MKKLLSIALVAAVLALSACSLTGQTSQGLPLNLETQQALIKQAVEGTATTSAMETQISQLQTKAAQPVEQATLPPVETATATLTPTETATVTQTPVPLKPTFTPVPPTATATVPTATATQEAFCNQAKFDKDVTIPDGTLFSPGASFTKTWRLKNSGTCTWTTSYSLVFVDGEKMSGPAAVNLPGNVAPGQVIDLSVNLVAPVKAGTYKGNWKLRDSAGVLFGLGKTNGSFYVEIKVSEPDAKVPLDMAATYCAAEWSSGDNTLPCPGTNNDSRGFVLRVDNPTLESGYIDNEPVLVTRPQMVTDSIIRGKYPAIRVESGYQFSAVIGCAYKATNCDVLFQLDYQVGSGSINTLKTWHEVYDEKFTTVTVDLSSLAGKDVKFILTVLSNGATTDDRAQWLAPKISKR